MGFSSAVENLIHGCWSKTRGKLQPIYPSYCSGVKATLKHKPHSLLQGGKGAGTPPVHSIILKMVLKLPEIFSLDMEVYPLGEHCPGTSPLNIGIA